MLLPHFVLKVSNFSHVTVPDPDLGGLVIQTIQTIQTLIWGVGVGEGVSPQISKFRPQFDLKMRGAGQAPRAPPLDRPLCNNLVIFIRGNVTGWSGCQRCNWVILALTASWSYILSSSDP